jgi:transcriptional regulator with XRE-family HTH domain
MDRSDADGLPVASSVTLLEAMSKDVPDAVSSPLAPLVFSFEEDRKKYSLFSVNGVDIQLNVEYYINIMDTFGDMLRRCRRESDLSQRELAKRVGVDFSYISKLENGRLPAPAAETILRLTEVMGTSAEELLAAAKKMPTEVNERLAEKPAALRFLQEATQMGLSEEEWVQLRESLRGLRLPFDKERMP